MSFANLAEVKVILLLLAQLFGNALMGYNKPFGGIVWGSIL